MNFYYYNFFKCHGSVADGLCISSKAKLSGMKGCNSCMKDGSFYLHVKGLRNDS